ncbi:uncharacterized protein LOC127856892 [Dreissena polymorpha]|uniref:Uncharacterized protein n=1 Tax=Dreissena polymorpha TaxID=45954 RepID=A0A9D3YZ73_DREPO|nr:uncharacterized protein LOC127856892 [Dreissena polymorpha]KAH3707996.1 hypothetical protein DPMN_067435 [Dreissena polymorpha]
MALSLTTPRSALRTLNEANIPIQKMQPQKAMSAPSNSFKNVAKQQFKPLGSAPDCSKPGLKIHVDPAPVKTKSKVKEKVIVVEQLPEIEKLFICNPEDEIRPRVDERAESMLRKLTRWGMPCLYGRQELDSSMSDDESDETEHGCKLGDIDEFDRFMANDLATIPEIEEIPLPPLDEIPGIEDLPLPFLDDSIDIEPNMGTLEVWDSSTPLTLSPASKNMGMDSIGDGSDTNMNTSV